MQIWGQAYRTSNSTFVEANAFRTADHQTILNASYMPTQVPVKTFAVQWPIAQEHPYFYVGIYTAITVAFALSNVLSATVQYTGALRASRKLFHRLLVGVTRATMRWHDITPQGVYLHIQGFRNSHYVKRRPTFEQIQQGR